MRTLFACLCLGLGACVAPSSEAAPEPTPVVPEQPAAPPAWADANVTESTTGRWDVRWTSAPTPIPENEPFALSVWVLGEDGAAADVELVVDAGMPEHGHGMNRVPRVASSADGGFQVDGLLFHMPGRWELYFDITQGALTERAQVVIELD